MYVSIHIHICIYVEIFDALVKTHPKRNIYMHMCECMCVRVCVHIYTLYIHANKHGQEASET